MRKAPGRWGMKMRSCRAPGLRKFGSSPHSRAAQPGEIRRNPSSGLLNVIDDPGVRQGHADRGRRDVSCAGRGVTASPEAGDQGRKARVRGVKFTICGKIVDKSLELTP